MLTKDRLAKGARRTNEHRLRVEDDWSARAELATAEAGKDEDRIAAAQARLDSCYETLHLEAMPADQWDDLLTAHPPTTEQEKRGLWCNPRTLLPAALVVCVLDSEVTEQDWADYIGKGPMAPGEAIALFDDLHELHSRSPMPLLPKDLGGSPS